MKNLVINEDQYNRLVKHLRQPNGISCGPTCIKMVADFFKGNIPSIEEICKMCGTDSITGTPPERMRKGLNQLDIQYVEHMDEENIDNDILVQDTQEQIVQMSNGCVCCSIRGDSVEALNQLWEQRKNKKIQFDHVVIETTGVANPGPVAQTFFIDDDIANHYVLDAVVTLVDAKHGQKQLNEHEEVQRQVGFADRIFITKTDIASSEEIAALKNRLMHMNPRAPIQTITKGVVSLDSVLDLRGFNFQLPTLGVYKDDGLSLEERMKQYMQQGDNLAEHVKQLNKKVEID